MFGKKSSWAVVALVCAAATATAQGIAYRPIHGTFRDVSRRIDPAPGDAGQPFCFGDGTGLPCPARNDGLPGHGCENSAQRGGALLLAQGVARISDDSVVLDVGGLPRTTTVLFMQGGKPPFQPYVYGDGIMCLGGTTDRLAVKRTSDSTARFPGRGDPSLHRAGNLPPMGTTIHYQVLYRDEHPFATRAHFNLSNGWTISWLP
jgi:hypothetical protein